MPKADKQGSHWRWLESWKASLPFYLRLAALLWAVSLVGALLRGGINTSDPVEIARRLLVTGAMWLVLVFVVVPLATGACLVPCSALVSVAKSARKR